MKSNQQGYNQDWQNQKTYESSIFVIKINTLKPGESNQKKKTAN